MSEADKRIAQLEDEILKLKVQLKEAQEGSNPEFRALKKRLNALDSMPDRVIFHSVRDLKTNILNFKYVSRVCEKILGVSPEAVLADVRNVFSHVHPDDLPRLIQQINHLQVPDGKFEVEVRYRHPVKEKEYWFQIASYPHREDDLMIADGFIYNITSRKNAEIQLKIEKERIETLGNNLPGGALFQFQRDTLTSQYRLIYVSATWEAVTGISVDVALDNISQVFSTLDYADYPVFMQSINESAQTLSDFNMVFRAGDNWLHVISRPRHDGHLIIWDGIIMNITERKNAEEAIAESERKYRDELELRVTERTEELQAANEELQTANEELTAVNDELNSLKENLKTLVEQKTKEQNILFKVLQIVQFTDNVYEALNDALSEIGSFVKISRISIFEKDETNNTLSITCEWCNEGIEPTMHYSQQLPAEIYENWFHSFNDGDYACITKDDMLKKPVAEIDRRGCRSTLVIPLIAGGMNYGFVGIDECLIDRVCDKSNINLFISLARIISNVIRRQKAESSLRRSQQELTSEKNRIQTIADNIPDGYLHRLRIKASVLEQPDALSVWHKHLQLLYVSGNWEKFTGIPIEDAMNDFSIAFNKFHPEGGDELFEYVRNRQPIDIEHSWKYSENDERWRWLSLWFFDEDGWIILDSIAIDITQRKLAEIELSYYRERLEYLVLHRTDELQASNKELKAITEDLNIKNNELAEAMVVREQVLKRLESSENKLRNFITQSFEGITIIDEEGRVIEWNPYQVHITKILRKDALGEYCWKLYGKLIYGENADAVTKEFHNTTLNILDRNNKDKLWDEKEFVFKVAKEKIRHIIMTTFRIVLDDRIHIGQIVRDVTRQKMMDLELEQYRTQLEQMVERRTSELNIAKEKAEESDRLKSAFLANMSHEIRTPLNGIVGFLQLINSNQLTPARRNEYFNVINNSSHQLVKLIEDIIDVSKIEANQMTINPTPVALNELMNELRMFYEKYMQSNDKEHIELILDDSEFIDNCVIFVDSIRLRQVLHNLIGNAVKFTEKGFIRFGYSQSASDKLLFVVEDSGIGLAADQQEIIFETFRQADMSNTTRLYRGTGLGLSISRDLVHMKGGDIWVESELGTGASFFFTISYLPVTQNEINLFEERTDSAAQKPFINKSVLLLEPIPLKFIYYEKIISATGANVTRAKNLQECYEILKKPDNFDIIIANVSFFENEDFNQILTIKNARPNLPIALIIPEKKEEYMKLIRKKLCRITVEAPVGYEKIMKILR